MAKVLEVTENSIGEVTEVSLLKGATKEVLKRHVASLIPLLQCNAQNIETETLPDNDYVNKGMGQSHAHEKFHLMILMGRNFTIVLQLRTPILILHVMLISMLVIPILIILSLMTEMIARDRSGKQQKQWAGTLESSLIKT